MTVPELKFDRAKLESASRDELYDTAIAEGFRVPKSITKAKLIDVLAPTQGLQRAEAAALRSGGAPQDVEAAGNGAIGEPSPVEATPGHSAASTTPVFLPVAQALGEVMRKVEPIAKDLRNVDARYAARSIDDVMDALHNIMAEQGVLPIPTVESAEYQDRGKQHQAILRVRWTFHGPLGDTIEGVTYGEALDSSDKATNKALQASLKYLLLDVFLIPINGDDSDADATSPEREPQGAPTPSADDKARERGWEDADSQNVAHAALATRIAKLPEAEREQARQMKGTPDNPGLGWPMPRQDFVGFARWVTEAERAQAEGDRPFGEANPEQLAAARAALADAEATVTGKATLRHGAEGQTVHSPLLNGDTVVCSTCGNSGPTITAIQHEEGCPEGEVL